MFQKFGQRWALLPTVGIVAFSLIAANVEVAEAASATTTSISASPSPVTQGQSVTLTATTNAPGTVDFSYGGVSIGTAPTGLGAATATGFSRWDYTGNSIALRLATNPAVTNVFISTWNPDDCGGGRCQTKQLSPGGGVTFAPSESWNGQWVLVTGLAVASNGTIYEGIYNGNGQNTIRKRTSIGASSTLFVPSVSICGTCSAGQGYITGMTIDASDNLYVTNSRDGSILKVTSAGVVSTYASGLGSPIAGPVINPTTGVLYYIDANKDIQQIPSGGGTATLLTAASCNIDTNPASSLFGNGTQLALDQAGLIYGAQCQGVIPSSTPNASPIAQINPASGAMREYLNWSTCTNGSLPNWAAGCGGSTALAFLGDRMMTAGASMGGSNVMGLNTSGYVATLTYTPPTAGSYAIGASLTPTDTNAFSGSSGSGTLNVVPATPSAPDLATASDLGTTDNDNITSDNTPRIEVPGSFTSGDTITVTATKSGSSNVTCTYVVPATGCDLGTLAQGTWSITATDTNPTSGASAASPALSITVDTTAPSAPTGVDLAQASDTGASNTDNNTNDNTPTVSASGGSTGDTMTLTATNGSTTVSCSYVLPASNCTLPTLTDGTWNVSATLTDPAGNRSTASTALPLSIDSTVPSGLTPDLVAASDTGSSATDDITSDTTPTISLPGQSNGDVITITASKNGSPDVSCTYTVGASTNCTLGLLADGSWNIAATITEPSGNTAVMTGLAVTIDSGAPPVPSGLDLASASDTGSSNSDNNSSDNTPTVGASGGAPGDTMTMIATPSGGGASVSCTFVVGQATSCDLGTLADGTWNLSANLTDVAGNVSTSPTTLPISIDSVTPSAPSAPDMAAASDTGSSSTDNLTSDSTPRIDVPGGTNGDTVTVTATPSGSGTPVSCTFVVGQATGCDLPNLADGDWNIRATLTDLAGNVSPPTSGPTLSIDATAVAPTDLDLDSGSDTGSSSTDNNTSDSTPTMSAAGGATGDTVTFTATNGSTSVTCSYVVPATSCTLGTLTDGTWNISATITDQLGNISPPSSPMSLVIDATAPVAPSAPDLDSGSDTGSSSTDNNTSDSTPTMSAAGGATGDTVTFTATNGSTSVTCSYVVPATSCTLGTLTDGTWNISATITDASGNRSPSSSGLSLLIDTTPANPVAPDLAANSDSGDSQSDNVTNDKTPTFGMPNANDGDTVTFTATDTKGKVLSCSFVKSINVSSCDIVTLTNGTWMVEAIVVDISGNQSTKSAATKLVINSQTSSSRLPTTGVKFSTDLVALWLATLGVGVLAVRHNRKRSKLFG